MPTPSFISCAVWGMSAGRWAQCVSRVRAPCPYLPHSTWHLALKRQPRTLPAHCTLEAPSTRAPIPAACSNFPQHLTACPHPAHWAESLSKAHTQDLGPSSISGAVCSEGRALAPVHGPSVCAVPSSPHSTQHFPGHPGPNALSSSPTQHLTLPWTPWP